MFTKKLAALAGGILLVTSATVAFATNAIDKNEKEEENEPAYRSSVQVDPKLEDQAALVRSARISVEDAARIAATTGGNVTEVGLENEDGSLVYAAEVTSGTTVKEVIIDAGNGNVLSTVAETEDDEESEDDEEDRD